MTEKLTFNPEELHDAILKHIKIDWEQGVLSLELELHESIRQELAPELSLVFYGFKEMRCPRNFPWAPSDSVNGVEVQLYQDNFKKCNIEMQSGDVISIIAEKISVEPVAKPPTSQ